MNAVVMETLSLDIINETNNLKARLNFDVNFQWTSYCIQWSNIDVMKLFI